MSLALPIEILFAKIGMATLQHHSEKAQLIFGSQSGHKDETAAARFRIKEDSSASFAKVFQLR